MPQQQLPKVIRSISSQMESPSVPTALLALFQLIKIPLWAFCWKPNKEKLSKVNRGAGPAVMVWRGEKNLTTTSYLLYTSRPEKMSFPESHHSSALSPSHRLHTLLTWSRCSSFHVSQPPDNLIKWLTDCFFDNIGKEFRHVWVKGLKDNRWRLNKYTGYWKILVHMKPIFTHCCIKLLLSHYLVTVTLSKHVFVH